MRGSRLVACVELTLATTGSAHAIFDDPDTAKFRSCLTLFAAVSPQGSVFHSSLDRFFDATRDPATLGRLA